MTAVWCEKRDEYVGTPCSDCACGNNSAKVTPLHPDRKSAAPLPPDPEVISDISAMLEDALNGKLIALAGIAFDPLGGTRIIVCGKATHNQVIGGLETAKFETLMQWSLNNAKPRNR